MFVNGRNVKVTASFANIGESSYYSTTREEVGKAHNDINAEYIWGLYDALAEKYPGKVQKKEHTNYDGTFTNYEYVISTGEYSTEGIYAEAYGCDPYIKKPKYLVLSGIHGEERKGTLSTYRFIRDVLSGHNVPGAFMEGAVISVMPVGTPSAFDNFRRQSGNSVDINRNFAWNWEEAQKVDQYGNQYTYGESAASEKETQAIVNWLESNKDAELFIDYHNSGALNEKVVVMSLPDNSASNIARKVALRGVDRIIPFWKDVIGYPDKVEASKMGVVEERDVIFSYSASVEGAGMAFAYAQGVLGIRSIAIETAVYYGDYSDYKKDEVDATEDYTYQAEPIAMGAEALGNILIEFYAQSCEVTQMTDIDSKMDMLLQQCHSGFRMESGTMVIEKDMLPDGGASTVTVRIPCSNGAKTIDFHADSDTLTAIKATSGVNYAASVLGNCFAKEVVNKTGNARSYMAMMEEIFYNGESKGWYLNDYGCTVTNTDGIQFACLALKAGTYHWKAYYWNDQKN